MRIFANHNTTSRGSSRADTNDHRPARLRSYKIPSSPTRLTRVSSSSPDFDFEFAIGGSDDRPHHQRSSTATAGVEITPAEDLFYKGNLLPLQPHPRLSMVKSLFFVPSSSSSANSRHSTCSSSSSDAPLLGDDTGESFRRSFVTDSDEKDDFIISPSAASQRGQRGQSESQSESNDGERSAMKSKSFSFAKFRSAFKNEPRTAIESTAIKPVNRTSASYTSSARDVMRKYMKKVKPLYEKMMARKQRVLLERESCALRDTEEAGMSSCDSGVLLIAEPVVETDSSSVELQSAIQGAIAHCKNSLL